MTQFSYGPPPGGYSSTYLGLLVAAIRDAFGQSVSTTEPVSSLLLQSQDKSVYSLTVLNDGTLKVTKVGK
jgi:hypothetical protein